MCINNRGGRLPGHQWLLWNRKSPKNCEALSTFMFGAVCRILGEDHYTDTKATFLSRTALLCTIFIGLTDKPTRLCVSLNEAVSSSFQIVITSLNKQIALTRLTYNTAIPSNTTIQWPNIRLCCRWYKAQIVLNTYPHQFNLEQESNSWSAITIMWQRVKYRLIAQHHLTAWTKTYTPGPCNSSSPEVAPLPVSRRQAGDGKKMGGGG